MIKIDNIIWSYNRSCQLSLLLRSTKDHFKNIGKIFVLWKASNEYFEKGYEKVINKDYGLNIEFIKETNFNQNIKTILSEKVTTEYVFGNSDDNIFIEPVEFENDFKLDDDSISFSLRLGKSIVFCLPANLCIDIPDFILDDGKYLKWNWTNSDSRGCWGYPHPVDSNIYRTKYWANLLENADFNNPKTMEEYMDIHRVLKYPYMQSFSKSKLISICANELGQGANLVNSGYNTKELNDRFLDNYIISTNNLYNIYTRSCHVLTRYTWER